MSQLDLPPGSARLQLADGIAVLRPEASVFEAEVTGWSHQQLARNLSAGTVSARVATIRRFRRLERSVTQASPHRSLVVQTQAAEASPAKTENADDW